MASLGLRTGEPRNFHFGPSVRSDLRLLEVDEALLKEIVETPGGVVIKGKEDDEAVLCTEAKTYALKLVETTNLQLLVRPPAEDAEQACAGPASQGGGTPASQPGCRQGLMTQWDHFRTADARAPILVAATSGSHIQLVETAPRLEPLRRLLWEHPYGAADEQEGEGGEGSAEQTYGDRDDDDDVPMRDANGAGPRGHTLAQLLAEVQSSPAELRAALAAAGALCMRGRWRAVEPSYVGGLLEMLLLAAQQEGMPLSALREGPLAAALRADGYAPELVRHCLALYGKPAGLQQQQEQQQEKDAGGQQAQPQQQAQQEPGVWALDEAKVCAHFAQRVLMGSKQAGGGGAAGGGMPLRDFLAAWEKAVPYGMRPSLDMLRAEALVEGGGAEARIHAFPAAALPADPEARFKALFARRRRWEWTALEPYLAGVRVPGQSAEALLMRYARASQATPESPLMYSAR